jgi:S-adenosylmethionine hydrolase
VIDDYVKFEIPRPRLIESEGTKKLLQGTVLHIDRFGNCITTFADSDLRSIRLIPRQNSISVVAKSDNSEPISRKSQIRKTFSLSRVARDFGKSRSGVGPR